MLCKECVCVLYGLQHSSLVLGILRQFLMELVVIKCDINDWLGVIDVSQKLCSSSSDCGEDLLLYNKAIMTFSHHAKVT
jgi:hypothetical protein